VSYDGATEALGRSQVVPYLIRLARTYDITLVSFEKSRKGIDPLRTELAQHGITWRPLRYHRRPPVLSTWLDVRRGRAALTRAAADGAPAIVHVRSYVPALMALQARRRIGGRMVFDIRGFWADERVEGGLWRSGGLLHRLAKRYEKRFFSQADAIVTLTRASVPQIRRWSKRRPAVAVEVIPTCVDLERFQKRAGRPGGPHAVWSGSIGTWYRFDLTGRVARALSLPLTVLTREVDLARRMLDGYPADVRAVAPDEMPGELFAGDVGLCMIVSSFSKTASAPTRFAEYLACGMPVLATPGVGDLDAIIGEHGVGVVLRGEDDHAISRAVDELRGLMSDPGLSERCRQVARRLFDADSGAARYAEIYASLTGAPTDT
jgi:glycosyltransferase involved in cell wall biosynthesis